MPGMSREAAVRSAMQPRPKGKTKPVNLIEAAEERRLIHLGYRIRRLPEQLRTARAKLQRLEEEARELGMLDLLENS